MKTYLIKKEFKSIWKWGIIAAAIQFIGFMIGQSLESRHSLIEIPYLMLTGELAEVTSPMFGHSSIIYFWFISILTAIVLPIVQMNPEIQNKTMTFLLHRPISKSDAINSKIVSGLVILVLSIGLQLGFVILVCSIPGNYAAPFEFDMTFSWLLCIYFSCCMYLAVLFCFLQEGKFKKWVALFSLLTLYWLFLVVLLHFSIWILIIFLLATFSVWYLAIRYSFEERDFS